MRWFLFVAAAVAAAVPAQSIPLLLVSGQNNHDWSYTSAEIQGALEDCGQFAVTRTNKPHQDLGALDLSKFAAIVLDYNGDRWGSDAERAFLAAVEGGTGVVVVHAANNAFPGWKEYEALVGLCWRDGTGHGAYHPFAVHVVDAAHPITQGIDDFHMHPDELYHQLVPMPGADYRVLMSAFSDPKTGGTGRFEPMATVAHYGKGRVFHTPLGHTWTGQLPTRATWRDPQLRHLLARATEWAATGAVTLPPSAPNCLSTAEAQEGFALLFDGRTLDGWRGYQQKGTPAQGWRVRHAAIEHQAQGGGGDLITADRFSDFDLRFQWRVESGANSGVIWHVLETEEQTYMTGPEYQIYDDLTEKPEPQHGAGALYDLVPNTGAKIQPAGTWNDGRILLHKGRVEHWLNGVRLLDVPCVGPEWEAMVAASKFRAWPFGRATNGHIALQDHGDGVAYRSLRIKRL